MKTIKLLPCLAMAAFATLAFAQAPASAPAPAAPAVAPAKGAPPAAPAPVALPEKLPMDDVKLRTENVPADTNALAALETQERELLAQSKGLTEKILATQRPLAMARQRVVADDPELVALSREIVAKQKELEMKLAQGHPDIAAKIKEHDELTREFSSVGQKLQDVRRKLDAIRLAIAREKAKK